MTQTPIADVRRTRNEIRWHGREPFSNEERESVLEQNESRQEHTWLAQKMTALAWATDPDGFRRISRFPAKSPGDSAWEALRGIVNDVDRWKSHNAELARLRQHQPTLAGARIDVPRLDELQHLASVLEPLTLHAPLERCPGDIVSNLTNHFSEVRRHAQTLVADSHAHQPNQPQAQELARRRQEAANQLPGALAVVWTAVAALCGWLAHVNAGDTKEAVDQMASAVNAQRVQLEGLLARVVAAEQAVASQSYVVKENVAAERAELTKAVAAAQESFRKTVDEWQKMSDQRQARPEALMKQAEEILAKARDASAATVVASYRDTFGKRARDHAAAGKAWLGVAVGFLIALFSYIAVVTIYWPAAHDTTLALAAAWVPRAVVGSVLLSAAVWCARVYGVHRHNEIVNQHRLAALSTFDILMNGAPTPEAKAAIVAAATNAIYSMQPTTPGGSSDPNVVLASELVRAASAGLRAGSGRSPDDR